MCSLQTGADDGLNRFQIVRTVPAALPGSTLSAERRFINARGPDARLSGGWGGTARTVRAVRGKCYLNLVRAAEYLADAGSLAGVQVRFSFPLRRGQA